MRYIKTIAAQSGHQIAIFKLDEELPNEIHPAGGCYMHHYVAKNFNADGITFFYLAKGHPDAPKQICVWYRNKKMWHSFGNNFEEAINGAQRDGWLRAE